MYDGQIVFTHWDDQRIYRYDPEQPSRAPVALTPLPGRRHGFRYADMACVPDGTEVWCVRETVTGPGPRDRYRELVAVPLSGAASAAPGAVRPLAASHRFLTGPKPSPDGRHVAWLGWDHPFMPWDNAELCVAEVDAEKRLGFTRVLAGGVGTSICQVAWDEPDSVLAINDEGGWWNLHRTALDGTTRNLTPEDREYGGPLWKIGCSWFAPLGGRRHVVLRGGRPALLEETTGELAELDQRVWTGPWSTSLAVHGNVLLGVASAADEPPTVARLDLERTRTEIPAAPRAAAWVAPTARHSGTPYAPIPYERMFAGHDGAEIPTVVYPPRNPRFTACEGELPPYLVFVHGGPTANATPVFDPEIAFFTSRGIGVAAVDYGGSTGHGRAYRERLREQWGVVDVLDCMAVAKGLAEEGTADPRLLAVRGASAGGFSAVRAVLPESSCFRCATALYPVLDLVHFGSDTHDFEAGYLDGLVGGPERRAERSVHDRAGSLKRPVLLLQGMEDEVCLPEHTERFAAQLESAGVPHALLRFEGEQHGFRRADSIAAVLTAELSFYGQVLGFDPVGVPRLELGIGSQAVCRGHR